jgi:hypothetical protein
MSGSDYPSLIIWMLLFSLRDSKQDAENSRGRGAYSSEFFQALTTCASMISSSSGPSEVHSGTVGDLSSCSLLSHVHVQQPCLSHEAAIGICFMHAGAPRT